MAWVWSRKPMYLYVDHIFTCLQQLFSLAVDPHRVQGYTVHSCIWAEQGICKHNFRSLVAPSDSLVPSMALLHNSSAYFLDTFLHSLLKLTSVFASPDFPCTDTTQEVLCVDTCEPLNPVLSLPCSSHLWWLPLQATLFTHSCGYTLDLVSFWNCSTSEVIKFTPPTLWPQLSFPSNSVTCLLSTFWFSSSSTLFLSYILCSPCLSSHPYLHRFHSSSFQQLPEI